MSEYGSGVTLWRRDGATIDRAEALSIVGRMEALAAAAERCGAFEEEPDCGLGWPADGGGYTLVATSSTAYKFALPPGLHEESMAHDVEYAEWLTQALEADAPGAYRYEVGSHEW